MWLGFQAILLSSTFFSSILARSLFERQQQCAVPCGSRCGLTGDTCCITPAGASNLCGYGSTCCFYGCCNFGSTCQPDGSCVQIITTTAGGKTITSTSTVGVPGSQTGSPATVTTITTVSAGKTLTLTSTIGAPGTNTGPSSILTTITTVSAGKTINLTSSIDAPTGLTTITTVSAGKTFTLTSTLGGGVPSSSTTQVPLVSGVSTETLPGGVIVTSASGTLFWGKFTVPVPTGLSTTAVVTTDGETFTFLPTVPPNPIQTGVSTETLPGGVLVTSSSGTLYWDKFTLPVPPGLSTTDVVTTDGETFTFLPTLNVGEPTGTAGTTTGTTTNGALLTFTTWPAIVSIIPVTTSVPGPSKQDGKPVIPCKAWFFFICISWNLPDLNIFGWQLGLPPGIYPPGPPPGLTWPPGFNLPGPLPPWPPLTIGNDDVPTYSDEPTSCGTESATIFLTTTSFAVSAANTTATQVLSTSSVIVGCDVQDKASTTTTTSTCPSTASTCIGDVIALTDDSVEYPITGIQDTTDALATLADNYVNSFWSAQNSADAALTTTTLPTNLPTLTETTTAPPTTLPIMTGAGSSCLSTITTFICTIPQQPCASSLSCAMWTTTTSVVATAVGTTTIGGGISTATVTAQPTPTWILDMYDTPCAKQTGAKASFNYYSLEGTGVDGPKELCISLQQSPPQGGNPPYDCSFFTDGGANPSQDCSMGTFTSPVSFVIRNGFCTVYSTSDCSGGLSTSNGIDSVEYTGCTDFSQTISLPTTWQSMQCFAYPGK